VHHCGSELLFSCSLTALVRICVIGISRTHSITVCTTTVIHPLHPAVLHVTESFGELLQLIVLIRRAYRRTNWALQDYFNSWSRSYCLPHIRAVLLYISPEVIVATSIAGSWVFGPETMPPRCSRSSCDPSRGAVCHWQRAYQRAN